MTTVFFATNRRKTGPGPRDFGAEMAAPGAANIAYGVAEVTGVSVPKEKTGTIKSVRDVAMGDFSQAAKDRILGADRNLLIFIHGADNTFDDAITRAAFNREWFAAAGNDATDTTVIAFTWPSRSFTLPKHSYEADLSISGRSGRHVASFLQVAAELGTALKAAKAARRVFLLAHSMGNHALHAGIEAWFDAGLPAQMLFDQVVLAAPDEVAGTFLLKNNDGLSALPSLADRITVYHSERDRLLLLSEAVNHTDRLGFGGADRMDETAIYPARKFRFVDCTWVADYAWDIPPDATHQYYRRSEMVRADITACLLDKPRPRGGVIRLAEPPPEFDTGG